MGPAKGLLSWHNVVAVLAKFIVVDLFSFTDNNEVTFVWPSFRMLSLCQQFQALLLFTGSQACPLKPVV